MIIIMRQFWRNSQVTYLGSSHRPQQLPPEIQQTHREHRELCAESTEHSSGNTGSPLTGRWPWIQTRRRRRTEELHRYCNGQLLKPFSEAFQTIRFNCRWWKTFVLWHNFCFKEEPVPAGWDELFSGKWLSVNKHISIRYTILVIPTWYQ